MGGAITTGLAGTATDHEFALVAHLAADTLHSLQTSA
jgi:hypothetical protein